MYIVSKGAPLLYSVSKHSRASTMGTIQQHAAYAMEKPRLHHDVCVRGPINQGNARRTFRFAKEKERCTKAICAVMHTEEGLPIMRMPSPEIL